MKVKTQDSDSVKICNQKQNLGLFRILLYTINRSTRIHQDTVYSQNCATNQCEVTVNNRRNPTRLPAGTRRPTTLITEWVKFATSSNTTCKTATFAHFSNNALLYYSQIADHTSINHGPLHPLPHKKEREREAVQYRWTSRPAPIHTTTPSNYAKQRGHRQKPQLSSVELYYINIGNHKTKFDANITKNINGLWVTL